MPTPQEISKNMKLVIFDIDGTLTKTNDVDTECFVQAFADVFEITQINTDWSKYGHTTDSGITLQIFHEQFERAPSEDELSKLQHRFVELLQQSYSANPELFAEIPGASVILHKISLLPDWKIAFATGGWRRSALMKLQAASLDITLPIATADDSYSREVIVTTAIEKAKKAYNQEFERIVCVGDGIWDILTAIQLQLPFIGAATNTQHQELQQAGVEYIITDFTDIDLFFKALNTATVPKPHKPEQIQKNSLPPSYFETLYTNNPDPWQFETSEYEAKKYTNTIKALAKPHYQSALEIGGSIGILTEKLAPYCETLLSVEVSKIAQEQARARCNSLPQVRFELMRIPEQFPQETFDLVLISEVGYYWCREDLRKAQTAILENLAPGGHLLLVHWTEYARDYPLTGDEVHDSFLELVPTQLKHLKSQREQQYRLDLFEKV
ncbi:putative methyltransferase [Calothrix sp. NIES-4071]|nr:putative methyltransferase [Calothrix sp. NIES-4071]BAZ58092.1 putative methyltransferase [Calothrix sp. NIES-4105]